MKLHTQGYKENVKLFGRELDSIITYELDGETIELGAEELNSVTPHYEGAILKSVMKQLDIDSNVDIPLGIVLNYQFGVKVENEYEYIDFGNYVVYKSEKQEDTNSWKITCYDKLLYTMKNYVQMPITYPITIRDYINAICNFNFITFANASDIFANYDREIQNELYLDSEGNSLNYTFRDVLDEIARVTASTICINKDDELEIKYINDTEDTIDEEYLKDINVNFGEKYGPVNSIVLSRSAESDNVYLQDEESIEENGLCELKIADNQIMNFNDRSDYLPDILEKLDGLEYYINDFSSTGITYYDLCDKYNISIGENVYPCIMFNDEINVTQGLEENIYTEMPKESETDYTKADKTDRRINQTWIIANKQEGEIRALTSVTSNLEDEMNNRYTIEQTNELVQNSATGITNTFSEAGGNNIFRNTGLWFEASSTEATLFPSNNVFPSTETFTGNQVYYEFWNGKVKKIKEDRASNMTAMELQNGDFYQEQVVPNGSYTISFKYQKSALTSTANVTVSINDVIYQLTETIETEFQQNIEVSSQQIRIMFSTDIDDSCLIYDLMVNAGSVKLAYSQNQNETTTDTVNISKGITITSSNTNTEFKADSDGIRIYDKNSSSTDPTTKFIDTGMETNQANIKGKSTIVGTLWQEVGVQTWITRL